MQAVVYLNAQLQIEADRSITVTSLCVPTKFNNEALRMLCTVCTTLSVA